MTSRRLAIAGLLVLALTSGCQRGNDRPLTTPRATGSGAAVRPSGGGAENPFSVDWPASAMAAALRAEDVLERITAVNKGLPLPAADFRQGHAEPLDFDAESITKTASGFVIQLPSESPIPTPTVDGGRLYVSGGFSSEEYYCFDAQTGDFVWGAKLDDDGPSSAVPFEDSIIFSCESCTIFALAADTGQIRWSHWLGDPLLSSPIVADGRVVIVYPAPYGPDLPDGETTIDERADEAKPVDTKEASPAAGADADDMRPTHVLACLDARTGDVIWRHWLDSDCMSAPVAVDGDLYVTTLTGIVYRLGLADGRFDRAERLRATSVPVIVGDQMYLTRRADDADNKVAECIVLHDRATHAMRYAVAKRAAPYLDEMVQRKAAYSGAAGAFETPNGIGGGFGGGFFGGQFSVPDDPFAQEPSPVADAAIEAAAQENGATESAAEPVDALAATQLQAAANFGLGNVSTLQSFQGSRILYWDRRLFSCMGDQVICAAAATGQIQWATELSGNIEEVGGHLASPPVAAGQFLFVTTVAGQVLRIDPRSGGVEERYDVGSPIRFPPAVDDGRIYISTQDGKIVCIDTGDRQLTGWPMRGKDAAHRNVAGAE